VVPRALNTNIIQLNTICRNGHKYFLFERTQKFEETPANFFLAKNITMNAATAAPTYTREEIDAAIAYREHARALERAKYQRNRAHRLAYAKAYQAAKRAERKAAEAAKEPAKPPAK
jgi:hypothetical protein